MAFSVSCENVNKSSTMNQYLVFHWVKRETLLTDEKQDMNKSSFGWNQTFDQWEARYVFHNFWEANPYSGASKNCSSENSGTE